jgi:ubiquinone/menaquinone biosynthesis C-methylase UbiE
MRVLTESRSTVGLDDDLTESRSELGLDDDLTESRSELGLDDDLTSAFDEAAPRYDLMVALNPGYHRELAAAARGLAETLPPPKGSILLVDLGCGSGASTRALVRAYERQGRSATIIGIDVSAGMLQRARKKEWPAGVRFERAAAQELAASRNVLGLDQQVDGVLAAYLFRNVEERDETLAAVHDLLRPGGTLVVQEYSVTGSWLAESVWTLVCWLVIIPLSWLTSGRTRLYRYLWRSARGFDSVQTFIDRLYSTGFSKVEVRAAGGWQREILHTFRAVKPMVPGS